MKNLALVFSCLAAFSQLAGAADRLPNVVIIYTDDQGYGDLGCFGSKTLDTPNIDRMAAEGARLTDFYVAQAVCGASRTALLTGCYPNRLGMLGAPGPKTQHGIHPDEVLIPEICKQKGYATAMFGKWHLGHHPQFLPVHNGFDEYFGLPYSNDMWPFHPTTPKAYPPLPMIEGDKIVDADVTADDQPYLTTWYTERAVKFIEKSRDKPFFLYVAHNMVHVPLFVSDKFKGKSRHGLYGDVVMEVDWSVGEILAALKKYGLDDNTLVMFATDNGPWLSYGNHAGTAGPLREGKGTTFEGGVRVPCVMRWPGKIPAGTTVREPVMTIDILPTIAKLIGATLPTHPIDGRDAWPVISSQPGAKSRHEAFYFYWGNELQAVRSGDWKLHFPHKYQSLSGTPGADGKPNGYSQKSMELALYNLRDDVGETKDVAQENPDVVARIRRLAEETRVELGDSATMQTGKGFRPPAKVMLVAPETSASKK